MSEAPRVLLAIPATTFLGTFLAADLRAGGIGVEEAHRARDALAAARSRPPDAIVTVAGFPVRWIDALARDAALARIPVVGVAAARPRKFLPFFTPLRWDAVVGQREAHEPGVVARATREVIARGGRRPTSRRERRGATLHRVGSALLAVGWAMLVWWVVENARGGGRPVFRGSLWVVPWALGHALGDVGTRLLAGEPARLSLWTWTFLALAAATLVLVVVAVAAAPR